MRDESSSALSPPRRRLVALLQRIRFGRVRRLEVRGGEPVLEGLAWTRTVKLDGKNVNAPHPASSRGDFALRKEVLTFLGQLDELGDGTVLALVVRDGLPAEFQLRESLPD